MCWLGISVPRRKPLFLAWLGSAVLLGLVFLHAFRLFLFCFQSCTANVTLRSSCILTYTHCALPTPPAQKVCSANCFIIFYLADWVFVSIGYAIVNCESLVSFMCVHSASGGFVCYNIHDKALSPYCQRMRSWLSLARWRKVHWKVLLKMVLTRIMRQGTKRICDAKINNKFSEWIGGAAETADKKNGRHSMTHATLVWHKEIGHFVRIWHDYRIQMRSRI